MSSISRISIVACGWLGTPLAAALIAGGYQVKGCRRHTEQLDELQAMGLEAYSLDLSPDIICDNAQALLESDLVLINIPPRRKVHSSRYHIAQINSLLDAVIKAKVKKVLFISSTSVYGNKNREFSELDSPCPQTESGKALAQIEQRLQREPFYQASILRFAGLVGGDRLPGRFLSGKQVSGGDSPVNLLHRNDCIAIIQQLIKRDVWGELFNVCCDGHPTREQLYTKAAKNMGLGTPTFDNKPSDWKLISNHKIKETLDYQFIYPDPLRF